MGKFILFLICGTEDLMIFNSIFPESALINVWTAKRPDIDHGPSVLVGNMRNSKTAYSRKAP